MSAKSAPQRRYATLKQAADYFQISQRTIRRWVDGGKITGFYFGSNRNLRVDLNEIEANAFITKAVA